MLIWWKNQMETAYFEKNVKLVSLFLYKIIIFAKQLYSSKYLIPKNHHYEKIAFIDY